MDKPIVIVREGNGSTFEDRCAKLAEQGYKLAYVSSEFKASAQVGDYRLWIAVMAKQEVLPASVVESLVNPYP